MKSLTPLLLAVFLSVGFHAEAQNHLIILNKSGNTAWQLDAKTGEKIAEYPTGEAPHEVALSPDKSLAAITNYGASEPGNSLTLIDVEKRKVVKTISLGSFSRPHGVEWFSDGEHLTVSAEAQQAVIIVNGNTGKVTKSIQTNQSGSHMVEISADEKRIFVPNLGSNSLTVLDVESGEIIETLSTGVQSEGITLADSGKEVWVTNRGENTISVVNTETLKIEYSLESSSFPIRAETSPNGKWVAVSNARSSTITIFDVSEKKLLSEVSTKTEGVNNGTPIGLIFSDNNDRLFVANSNADQIVVIDTSRWEVIKTFKTGDTPDGITFIGK